MPVLHRQRKGNVYYVFTEIQGKIIAFKLTHDGERKLKSAGILPGKVFGRAMLLDLYRTGDAFTSGRSMEFGQERIEPRQLQFDFINDPEPESLFPLCSICSSPDDLHLVEMKDHGHYASLLCNDCRLSRQNSIDTSIPLAFVTRTVLRRLLEMKQIEKKDSSVSNYQVLLEAEFKDKWETLKKRKRGKQVGLFEADP
jgi:hypothetical protein